MNRIRHIADSASTDCTLPFSDRTAIVVLAMFLLFVISVPKYDISGVIVFASVPALLVTAAGIPPGPILKRLVIASPFILFMAGGNLLLDRTPALTVSGQIITGGMLSSAVIVLKTLVTLTALLSLVACIPFHRFGIALRALGVPEVFVTQLVLVYRYSFLLAEEAGMMQKARDLRSFGGKGRGPIVTARLIGSLLIRTTGRAERIFMAMTARGFVTALHDRPQAPVTGRDLATVAAAFGIFVALRLLF